jgi:hypothetical protein
MHSLFNHNTDIVEFLEKKKEEYSKQIDIAEGTSTYITFCYERLFLKLPRCLKRMVVI